MTCARQSFDLHCHSFHARHSWACITHVTVCSRSFLSLSSAESLPCSFPHSSYREQPPCILIQQSFPPPRRYQSNSQVSAPRTEP